ncbi:dihydroneopterin aldolase [Candidatus Erwinia haradaeae]|uniref:7,8-dihydroneopterin aldolase n=1 Tax=Candidatus Erwinia haradaeae TaxID=1922217 RepID=A0A451DM62_9GAMM|nr:dihydroneopterin aldolase [Candidatus Erwinia haradaeae]VFP87762.1 Dihydroneopterin aldolase [Candidatus Erwinia haradaeae]
MDIIFIDKLSVITIIGIYDWEKIVPQKLLLDLQIGSDSSKAGMSDNIKDCLNYTSIVEAVITFVSSGQFSLIERVAEEVAALLLNKFSSLWIRVKVSKPSAVEQAEQVGVIIERGCITEPIACIHCSHRKFHTSVS